MKNTHLYSCTVFFTIFYIVYFVNVKNIKKEYIICPFPDCRPPSCLIVQFLKSVRNWGERGKTAHRRIGLKGKRPALSCKPFEVFRFQAPIVA